MLRALALATLFLGAVPHAPAVQAPRVLHIKIVLVDADGKATPIPHYLLLVSDNPATALPRRVVTALDGTAEVSLRPGNYTVESDRPVAFQGKAYQWTQIVDIVAGRDAILELKADNAEVETATSATASAALLEADPSSLLALWQDSVVAIWTPTTHASGFVIDAGGLIATNQRVIGTATSVEVQLTPAVKVVARVLTSDAVRDVAVLAIDPKVLASVRAVPMACAEPRKPVAEGQELFTIGAPLRGQKGAASGTVSRVEPHAIVSDLILATGSAGGPVFDAGGDLVGITTAGDDRDEGSRRRTRIARIDGACGVIASADSKLKDAKPPDAAHLPVEPLLPFPADALKEAAKRRAGSLSPYQMSTTEFDVNFITPILIYGAQYQAEQVSGRERGTRKLVEPGLVRPLLDFGNWSDYMADYPPVLVIRVTPKLVENFWTTVARGAARTQGMALPPMKHFKSGFSRMQAFCGDAEVTPIHPFKLEQRLSEKDAIYEGLYVFDPGALGPHCGTVKLVLYSEKAPVKADTRVVDPKVVEQVWKDFAPYRP
jgi:S1-C subfamily serine protease